MLSTKFVAPCCATIANEHVSVVFDTVHTVEGGARLTIAPPSVWVGYTTSISIDCDDGET
jgi:hypothetical protein